MKKWTGLAEVSELPGQDILDGAKGAFVHIVGIAQDEDQFLQLISNTLVEHGCFVISVEDIKLFNECLEQNKLSIALKQLAHGLSEQCPVLFDAFHAYDIREEKLQ